MRTVLFVLQLAGGLLAAGAAMASLLKSKPFEEIEIPSPIYGAPPRTQRRLTREAKIGAILVISGFFVSLVAGIISQLVTSALSAQAQQAAAGQLRRAEEQMQMARESLKKLDEESRTSRESLQHLERLATRLEEVEVDFTLVLETDDLSWSDRLYDLARRPERFVVTSSALGGYVRTPAGLRTFSYDGTIEGYSNMFTQLSALGVWTNETAEPISELAKAYYHNQTNLPPPPRLPGMPPGLCFGTIPTNSPLSHIIEKPVAGVAVFSGPAARTGETVARSSELVASDLALISRPEVAYVPPGGLTNLGWGSRPPSGSTNTASAIIIAYRFGCNLSHSSLPRFPRALPDLASKEAALTLTFTNELFQVFRRLTCTNLLFNFGHSVVASAASFTAERGGDVFENRTYPFPIGWTCSWIGRAPTTRPYQTIVNGFELTFQFPDRDSLLGRTQPPHYGKGNTSTPP